MAWMLRRGLGRWTTSTCRADQRVGVGKLRILQPKDGGWRFRHQSNEGYILHICIYSMWIYCMSCVNLHIYTYKPGVLMTFVFSRRGMCTSNMPYYWNIEWFRTHIFHYGTLLMWHISRWYNRIPSPMDSLLDTNSTRLMSCSLSFILMSRSFRVIFVILKYLVNVFWWIELIESKVHT